jgi:phosphate starvation-inducible protein PhoH
MIMSDRNKVKTVTQIKSNQICENKRQALSQIKRIDWKSLEFRTPNQKTFYNTISRNDVTFSVGPAGCGKTFLATHYALKNLAKGKYDKMVNEWDICLVTLTRKQCLI